MQTVAGRVLSHILSLKPGAVFTPAHVSSLGARAAVDQALSRGVKTGVIQRIGRGLYHVPEYHHLVGQVPPSPETIAYALAEARGERLQMTGLAAANALGLITQMQARPMYYLASGVNRPILKNLQLKIAPAGRSRLAGAGTVAGMVFQALRFMGPRGVTPATIRQIRARLPRRERVKLGRYRTSVPGWIRPHLEAIIGSGTGKARS